MAINYFICCGYTVSLPINDTQWYDIVIEKDGKFETVQCRATYTKNSEICLCSTGGTKGAVYDRITNHSELDYLFCVDRDLKMWLIPIKDIPNSKSIKLRSLPNSNNQGFQTYKYQVQINNY